MAVRPNSASARARRFYRRMIIAYSVCLVGFMVLGFWWMYTLAGQLPQLSDAMELVLIVMACRR